jgi:hypothetical protein
MAKLQNSLFAIAMLSIGIAKGQGDTIKQNQQYNLIYVGPVTSGPSTIHIDTLAFLGHLSGEFLNKNGYFRNGCKHSYVFNFMAGCYDCTGIIKCIKCGEMATIHSK